MTSIPSVGNSPLVLVTESAPLEVAVAEVLGYLNFSNGKPDARFQRHLNHLGNELAPVADGSIPARKLLLDGLEKLQLTSPAFSNSRQARGVLEAVFDTVIPAYVRHHGDLLFHVPVATIYQGFFVARVFEAALAAGGPWDERERIATTCLDRLNDFLGHRPVAVLENGRKMQPYPHERFRPVPLYLRGAGVAVGRYQTVLAAALQLLATMSDEITSAAFFGIDRLDELALDVRAYDHSHPVYKRTNYTFGEWDPHEIDGKGYFRRFVLRQIILDALCEWIAANARTDPEEALFEAGAVLAGTMLMASAVSGDGPATHDSNVSLSSLLPRIARQRDAFYDKLLQELSGPRGERLRAEARDARQAFGRIRQFLNLHLAHFGCRQMQRSHLAYLYARIGSRDAARRQSGVIPSTAVRFETEIQWRFTAAHQQLDRDQLDAADQLLRECEELLRRGIDCGGLVDPWNILGFQGQFPLFHSREDSIPDQRVEKLLFLVEQMFNLYCRVVCEAAVAQRTQLVNSVQRRLRETATWWDAFATTVVTDLPQVLGADSAESSAQVASILAAWFESGRGSGDIAFWKSHVGELRSAKAFAIVLEVLLRKRDLLAVLNLMLQWLSENSTVPLESGAFSFHSVAARWMNQLVASWNGATRRIDPDGVTGSGTILASEPGTGSGPVAGSETRTGSEPVAAKEPVAAAASESASKTAPQAAPPSAPTATLTASQMLKFFDHFDACAGDLGQVPGVTNERDGSLRVSGMVADPERKPPVAGDRPNDFGESQGDVDGLDELGEDRLGDDDDRDGGDGGLFDAAYEGVVYRDSASDGHHGDTVDSGGNDQTETELDAVSLALEQRIRFLVTRSQLWRAAAEALVPRDATVRSPVVATMSESETSALNVAIHRWIGDTETVIRGLSGIVETLQAYEPGDPSGDPDSLSEFDRVLHTKFTLINSVMTAQVACFEAARGLRSCIDDEEETATTSTAAAAAGTRSLDRLAVSALRQLRMGDAAGLRADIPRLLQLLTRRPLLYVPIDQGGKPRDILTARNLQSLIRTLLSQLPRLGLLRESWHLLKTAFHMERTSPPAGMSITEFDRLMQTALRASVQAVLRSAPGWNESGRVDPSVLAGLLQRFVEPFHNLWLQHSRTMRLSSAEVLQSPPAWRRLKAFIKKYGGQLFEPRILTLGNLRAILHRGTLEYLDYLMETDDPLHHVQLLDDLNGSVSRDDAADQMELIFRCLVEKFDRFMEYNTTTTQSDYGEQLFCLLDFLRLESEYEREAWNLLPLVLVHEVMAREGFREAAELWQQQLAADVQPEARTFLSKLRRLEKAYSVRLPSVTDRINERFVKPLALDRILALVRPAMRESDRPSGPQESFADLESRVEAYLESTSGSPTDLQPWLQALGDEVHAAEADYAIGSEVEDDGQLPQQPISLSELREAMEQWSRPLRPGEP